MSADTRAALDLRTAPIGIVGAGRLGAALGEALTSAGYAVRAIASRTPGSAQALASRLPGAEALTAEALVARVDVVWLTLPDVAIEGEARSLPWRAGQIALHCAGGLGLDVLDAARAVGVRVGCLHPLQSFPDREHGGRRFAGVACGIEAEGALDAALRALARDLGAVPFSLAGVDRARYHAAAVLASNCVVALHAAAERAWSLAGLPAERARTALAPLTLGAADAIARLPLAEALTGPVARGDVTTVARHLDALAADPALGELYRRLGEALLALPLTLSTTEREALARVFRPA